MQTSNTPEKKNAAETRPFAWGKEHTPGPWEWRVIHSDRYQGEEHEVVIEQYVRDASGLLVATIGGGELSEVAAEIHRPNARLIAAAPELLEALKRLLMHARRVPDAAYEQDADFARAVIAKAVSP